VPKFLAGDVETVPLPETENVDVAVVLYTKNGTQLSDFYFRMLPGVKKDDTFNRLVFEVKR
jgi:hypothetical protein